MSLRKLLFMLAACTPLILLVTGCGGDTSGTDPASTSGSPGSAVSADSGEPAAGSQAILSVDVPMMAFTEADCARFDKFSSLLLPGSMTWSSLEPVVARGHIELNAPIPDAISDCAPGKEIRYTYPILVTRQADILAMIEAGADPDVVSSENETVAGSIARDFRLRIPQDAEKILGYTTRIDVNSTTAGKLPGYTPLGHAAVYNRADFCASLLNKGADPNRLQVFMSNQIAGGRQHYSTPLWAAAIFGSLDAFEVILADSRTDPNSGAENGEIVITYVLGMDDYSPDRKSEDLVSRKLRLLDAYVAKGGKLDGISHRGEPVWMSVAAKNEDGYLTLYRALVKHGADMSKPNKDNRTFEEEMLSRGWAWALESTVP